MTTVTEPLVDMAEEVSFTQTDSEFDFIDIYADYADILEAPRQMHEIVAMVLLATILNRNGVTIPLGGVIHSLDVWVLLLSGSGFGRSTLVGLPRPLLELAGLAGILREETWGSPQALYQQLAENPTGLFIWGEMSEKLKTLSQPRFENAKQWITDRYDNLTIPAAVRYRMNPGAQNNTQPIVFTESPRINILATSSNDWFFANLEVEDSTGGFIPRWMIVTAKKSDRIVPIPRIPDPALAQPLIDHLKKVSNLTGEIDLSDIIPAYVQWYAETKLRFESQPNQLLADPYFNRHRVHVLQLAALFEVSMTGSLHVSMQAWDRAVKFCKTLEVTIYDLLATGMNSEGHSITKMEMVIRNAGEDGMPKSDFTRAFQHEDPMVRDRRLKTLREAGKVLISGPIKKAMGRPATYYVHTDHVESYVQKHGENRTVPK